MYIYFSLLFPVIGCIILYTYFKQYVAWWESSAVLIVVLLFTILMKSCGEIYRTTDEEYLQDYVVRVEHYDEWDEWIEQTCTRKCCCTTNSKGEESCGTESYDCSYRQYYPEYWKMITSRGQSYSISKQDYYRLLKQFKATPTFVDMNRDYYTIDGDMQYFKWDNNVNSIEYVTTLHRYENRIQASSSVLNFQDVDTNDIKYYDIKEYPTINNNLKCKAILGDDDNVYNNVDKYINQTNSLFASKKQVKIFYLIYKNKPLQAGLTQESYWKGGNKNEVNICIGIDSITREVKWSYVFSWTKNDIVKIKIRDYINNTKILNDSNYYKVVDYSNDIVYKYYSRRHFKEFYYLNIEPSFTLVVWTYIISFMLTIGMCIFVVKNEIN